MFGATLSARADMRMCKWDYGPVKVTGLSAATVAKAIDRLHLAKAVKVCQYVHFVF